MVANQQMIYYGVALWFIFVFTQQGYTNMFTFSYIQVSYTFTTTMLIAKSRLELYKLHHKKDLCDNDL